MLGNMDFYAKSCNDWQEKGVQKNIRWAFVGDFDLKASRPPAESGEDTK